jgi:hypothetical protein
MFPPFSNKLTLTKQTTNIEVFNLQLTRTASHLANATKLCTKLEGGKLECHSALNARWLAAMDVK